MQKLSKVYVRCTTQEIFNKSLLILSNYSTLVTDYDKYCWKNSQSILLILQGYLYNDSEFYYDHDSEYKEISYEDLITKY